ncbi:YqeG family HAD IIIA-type phosphatase [Bacillus sp. DNRA2]|uniref:YqeG family HAD IIIA-type phosphatase n=1 Tax=Bacillus sp. DNRA2 TaxID=2723053 RepID=UPI00145CDFBE|nr:YqeG family HAD IIIA-type phosphatase [Bacillus sp. DNRA2]NMD70625.1 YqeG family HAD IIIA-type phosphatase [Bacillus sp. DNRA2]
MIKNFLPDQHVKSVFDISPQQLKSRGIKAIITDLDNTLVEWDRPNATPKLIEWFKDMEKNNILITIVSNNNEERVKAFSEPHKIPYIFRARKPMGRAFQKALRQMNVRKEEVVVIGDQLLTDVFGGNRSGIHTILVVPVAKTDGFFTKFNRQMERVILNWFRKKGMIQWED